ncbi:MAG: hypothetical protein J6Q85_01995 [Clostridia bacterium]|nr:hypothetical protein [Clostridia bacterium]
MKKTDFYSIYRISDTRPIDVTRRTVSVADFACATKSFLNDNFRGLCNVSTDVPQTQHAYVIVSGDQTAYFFKVMLSYIRPEKYVNVEVALESDKLTVTVSSEGHLPFSEPDALEIIKLARCAGFHASITNEIISLHTKAEGSMRYQVYAISVNDLMAKFHEIFYTGITERHF